MAPDTAATGPLETQRAWLATYAPGLRVAEQGTVMSVGDGIAWIAGLPSATLNGVLELEHGGQAMVFDLSDRMVGAVILRDSGTITSGTTVRQTRGRLAMPVCPELLGRIVDPLGSPLDGGIATHPDGLAAARSRLATRSWPATSSAGRCTPASRSSTR